MTIEQLNESVLEFSSTFLKKDITINSFSDIYSLENHWPQVYPNNQSPGIYIFLDSKLEIYYIGSTVCSIGERFHAYFTYDENRRCRRIERFANVYYLTTISLENNLRYLAPSLEYFLISKYRPIGNVNLLG